MCPVAMKVLDGKKGLVVGIANERSIAYGWRARCAAGAELAVTYVNSKAEPYVRPLAQALQSAIVVPCDVTEPGQLEEVFERIGEQWGRLDFLLHSIAYAPRRICTAASSIARQTASPWRWRSRAIRSSEWPLAEPLMADGGCLLTVSYYGSEKVVPGIQSHGAGQGRAGSHGALHGGRARRKRIRVNALSPGPLKTRAASGIERFDELLDAPPPARPNTGW